MSDLATTLEPQPLRVSAILLAYNQAAQTRRAIEALEKSRDREHLEIIVVDCGSRDGTASVDAEFPGINMLRLPHHIGAARAWNIATRTAKAPLLLFVSPDVEVLPDTASRLAEVLDADPETVAACPLLIDEAGKPSPRVYSLPLPAAVTADTPALATVDLEAPSAIDWPSFDALITRKRFVEAMNYFDQRYGHYWVDAEFAMQARRAGRKVRLIPDVHAVVHPGGDPLAGDSLAAADRIAGAAAYAGKYGGSGFGLRMGAALKALGSFNLGLFAALLGGSKLDGGQAG